MVSFVLAAATRRLGAQSSRAGADHGVRVGHESGHSRLCLEPSPERFPDHVGAETLLLLGIGTLWEALDVCPWHYPRLDAAFVSGCAGG